MSGSNGNGQEQVPEVSQPKKRAFLAAYASLGAITKAAQVAGINRRSHYNWHEEEGPDGDAYRMAFEDARASACDSLEVEARRRAMSGVDKPVYYQGERVDTLKEYSDTLLIFLLKGAMPEKYRENARIEHTGRDGGPIVLSAVSLSDDELESIASGGRQRIVGPPPGANGTS